MLPELEEEEIKRAVRTSYLISTQICADKRRRFGSRLLPPRRPQARLRGTSVRTDQSMWRRDYRRLTQLGPTPYCPARGPLGLECVLAAVFLLLNLSFSSFPPRTAVCAAPRGMCLRPHNNNTSAFKNNRHSFAVCILQFIQ